jgi:hypothetical protein
MLAVTACSQPAPQQQAATAPSPTAGASVAPLPAVPVPSLSPNAAALPSALPAPGVTPRSQTGQSAALARQALPPPPFGKLPAVPTPQFSALVTAVPVATRSPATVALMLPPNAQPRILRVNLNKTTVHGGDTVRGTVVTSSNVASVEARIAVFSMSVPKVGVGRFQLSYVVPKLPFFLHHTYEMLVIARNTRGEETIRSIPITVQ